MYRLTALRFVWSVMLPPLLVAGLAIFLYFYANGLNESRKQLDFERKAVAASLIFENSLASYLGDLYALAAFFEGSDFVSRREFSTFARRIMPHKEGIQALEWAPWIAGSERDAFVKRARNEGFVEFDVRESSPSGDMAVSPQRDFHIPITYIEPMIGNEIVMGFDLAATPVRRQALLEAKKNGEPIGTPPLRLLQETSGQKGVVVYMPLKDSPLRDADSKQRDGFAIGVFRIEDLVQFAFQDLTEPSFSLDIFDITNVEEPLPFCEQCEAKKPVPYQVSQREWSTTLDMVGRKWRLDFKERANAVWAGDWQLWLILLTGLAISLLLGFILYTLARQRERIEKTVEERTQELHEANERVEEQLHRIEVINSELYRFTSIASHDLKAPLRRIGNFVELVQRRERNSLSELSLDYFVRINKAIGRMETLIADLLEYSRFGRTEPQRETINLMQLGKEVLIDLEEQILAANAQVTFERLPEVEADRVWMQQMFQNLLSNAVKYRRDGVIPRIRVHADTSNPQRVLLMFEDNGIGISTADAERIFSPFERLHSYAEFEGSGIGLATVRRIVERHGGQVSAEPRAAGGSVFTVSLPQS